MKNNRIKGFSILESMLSVSIIMIISAGIIYWVVERQKTENAVIMGQDIVKVISAIDKRINIDGLNSNNFKNGKNWNNSEDVINMLKNEFITKESSCGKTNGWEPQSEDDKDLKLLPCNFWNKIPYNLEARSFIEEDGIGYINKFYLVLNSKNTKIFEDDFRFYNKAILTARANDSANITGTHMYYFANKNNVSNKITNSQCLNLKEECVIVASFEKNGGAEFLKVDGTNSMIGSSIGFKKTKTDLNNLKCVKWEKDISDVWNSKIVDCGIGFHKESGLPVSVDIAVNSLNTKNVILDKSCPIYEENSNDFIDTGEVSPCGLIIDNNGGVNTVIQLVDKVIAEKGILKNIYSEKIYSDDITTGNLNVTKDLKVDGNTDLGGNLNVKKLGKFEENIHLTKVETAGASCSPNGLLARDAAGGSLSCRSGVWVVNLGIGSGQKWFDMSGLRTAGVTYTNTTGMPIQVSVSIITYSPTYYLIVDGVTVGAARFYPSITNSLFTISQLTAIVPANSTYRVTGGVYDWAELR